MNYEAHYNRLIEKARGRKTREGYFEKHHVIPKCLGGSDVEENLVYLTAEEHYVAHQLLVKINPGVYALSYAALLMTRSSSQTVRTNKLYGWLKRKFSEDSSEFQKFRFSDKTKHPCFGKFGADHPKFGVKLSEESRLKISVANKGKVVSEDSKKKLSASLKVALNRPEYKLKISAVRKIAFSGEKNPAYGTKLINNGVVRKRIQKDAQVPEGWKLGGVL